MLRNEMSWLKQCGKLPAMEFTRIHPRHFPLNYQLITRCPMKWSSLGTSSCQLDDSLSERVRKFSMPSHR